MSEKLIEIEAAPNPRSRRARGLGGAQNSVLVSSRRELMKDFGFESSNKLQLVQLIRNGVQVSSLYALADRLKINVNEVSVLVNISSRTFNRRKREGKLQSDESERVYRLADLMARATEVLHSDEEARYWLKTPKKALGGETPLDLADTEVGAKEVKDLLGRIEHGVFS